jgi:hypothetical protein
MSHHTLLIALGIIVGFAVFVGLMWWLEHRYGPGGWDR